MRPTTGDPVGGRAPLPPGSATASLSPAEVAKTVADYERFISERLQPDLAAAVGALEKTTADATEYRILREQLEQMDTLGLDRLKLRVNLGGDFFAQARVDDASTVFVNVGLGFHAELSRAEARAFCARKEAQLEERAAGLREQAGRIRAHVQVLLDTIHQLSGGQLSADA
mmetsp:Transcript_11978/g.35448  ORF Transcript_11978/g.35448 Transcript_11978/m.35448 type:complete len:171 (-) Transcript_11978:67-579(-)